MNEHRANYLKGRGAQINVDNPYENRKASTDIDQMWYDSEIEPQRTTIIDTFPKTIVNKVHSPDVPGEYSMNPYQGCEHGCIYCYARNTHAYWGYNAGLDFETKILVKRNAPELLEKQLRSRNWKASPIMLSGNTDCYQPVERELKITRQLLEVLLKYKHPVSMITKNALILRDLDLLTEMHKYDLVSVAISINTVDDAIRKVMEPRTASVAKRLSTIRTLVEHDISVTALAAPIIPGLTDDGIFELAKAVSEQGCRRMGHLLVRLNGDIQTVFKDWALKNYPDRYDKILNKIKSIHGGDLGSSRYKERMRGGGNIADIIHQQFALAKKKYGLNGEKERYNTSLFDGTPSPQMSLFD